MSCKDEDATKHYIVQDNMEKESSRWNVLAGQAKSFPAQEGIEKSNKFSYKLPLWKHLKDHSIEHI